MKRSIFSMRSAGRLPFARLVRDRHQWADYSGAWEAPARARHFATASLPDSDGGERSIRDPGSCGAITLVRIDPEAQRLGADERYEIALPPPGRGLAQCGDQFIVGLRARRRTGTILQRTRH